MTAKFMRNAWYCAASSTEVGRKPLGRVFLNEPVVLYRRQDGTAVALQDTCPHRRAPLHIGTVVNDNIQCNYHGIIFDAQGKAVWAQGQDKLPSKMCVRSYPVAERQGWVFVWMGAPELADETKLFDCSNCVDPKWAVIYGMIRIQAPAMMVIDNLMDLSHTAFVHAATMGSSDDLDPKLTWERSENWIKGTRIATDLKPSPQQMKCGAACNVDVIKTMAYTPPYYCNVDIYSTETGKELGKGQFLERYMTYSLITPETDESCFFFWANTRDLLLDDKVFHEMYARLTDELLAEDKFIIEETYRAFRRDPNSAEVDLIADAGGTQARRILKNLIDGETDAPVTSRMTAVAQ